MTESIWKHIPRAIKSQRFVLYLSGAGAAAAEPGLKDGRDSISAVLPRGSLVGGSYQLA